MFSRPVLLAVALAAALAASPAGAQEQQTGAPAPAQTDAQKAEAAKKAAEKAEADKKAEAEKKAAADKEAAARRAAALFQGAFQSDRLAGATVNDFRVPQLANQLRDIETKIVWQPTGYEALKRICDARSPKNDIYVASKAPERTNPESTTLGIWIASPPCFWPLAQDAEITITAKVGDSPEVRTLFAGRLPVGGFWFAFCFTILILALIYPGGATASWYASQRRYQMDKASAKPDQTIAEPPSFWATLDPVELTKNPYGRGSIAKLQIFVFSFIVFGLLLFNVLRTGLLANMSTDVLYLMGISAAGAAGGKIAYLARRRLNLENWAWLRRKGWLPPDGDVAKRAKWSDLFVDSGTKEFDPYRFQMAVFSVVVAIALVKTSATSLEAFQIPTTMLTLLGISQTVFVAGQALDKGGYEELDKKLDEVRQHEKKYRELKAKVEGLATRAAAAPVAAAAAADNAGKPAAGSATPPPQPKPEDVTNELTAFKSAVAQAAEMYWAIYGPQLGEMPEPLQHVEDLMPEAYV